MNIFLTGATGFLGGKLIQNLLKEKHSLFLLYRDEKKAKEVKQRFSKEEQENIYLIKGDITSEYCGLSNETIEELTNRIDLVYHLAALVKFDVELEEELKIINYQGTKHVLDLAKLLKIKHFLHVSTAYTVGSLDEAKEELYSLSNAYNNPYEYTKSKAEHLVFSYNDFFDISIFRPSIIVGDSKTGEADSTFTLYGFMRILDIFKRRMSKNKDWNHKKFHLVSKDSSTSNFVPVDYVASILGIASTKAEKNKIYHITNHNPPKNSVILEKIKKAMNFYNLKIVEKLDHLTPSDDEVRLNEMLHVFNPYLNRQIVFSDYNTNLLMKETHVEPLNLNDESLSMIIHSYFHK